MKTLIDNQGNEVKVSEIVYDALKLHYEEGDYTNIIKDICGFPHIIILPYNFI